MYIHIDHALGIACARYIYPEFHLDRSTQSNNRFRQTDETAQCKTYFLLCFLITPKMFFQHESNC